MKDTKMAIIIRTDLNMTKGKMVTQGSHATLNTFIKLMNNGKLICEQKPELIYNQYDLRLNVYENSYLDLWLSGIYKKITLKVNSEEELLKLKSEAENLNLPNHLQVDLGLTMFNNQPTITALAIGPADAATIDKITSDLKLL